MSYSVLPASLEPSSYKDVKPQEKEPEISSSGFRIKKVAHIAFCVLAATLAAVVLVGTVLALTSLLATPVIPAAILATVTLAATVALSVLLLMKMWQVVEPHMPNFIRTPINYLQSTICALISGLALAIIWPLDLEKKNPTKEQCNKDQTPILMIHGFLGSSNNWLYHRNRLQEEGFKNLFTINLGNPLLSIDDYADKVHEMVLEIQERTERKDIQIICHSMGGLVARQYNQKYADQDGAEVKDIITLGTPLDGTKVAKITMGLSKSAKEMYPESEFVKAQQNFAAEHKETHYYHIASECDLVIRPLVSAVANGRDPKDSNVKVKWLKSTGHVSYLLSDAAGDAMIRYLKGRRLPQQSAASAA